MSFGISGYFHGRDAAHGGQVMQIFLSPNLEATWLFTAWVLRNPTETCEREQSGMSAESPSPRSFLDLPHNSVISDLCLSQRDFQIPR